LFSYFLVTLWNTYDIGTVAASIADIDFVQKRKGIEQTLEDGTISFLSISSLRYGFKIIDILTISAIARYYQR
jgi:molybdenum cofactor sulfurtransferase